MTPAELQRQRWQYVSPVGVIRDPPGVPALYTRGIVGGEDYCIAITVNGNRFNREPGETWDALLYRVRNDLAARGDPANIATCAYWPHVEPREVNQRQPGFQHENARW